MSLNSSHRPHRKGHDYYDRGIYLITIVVKHRDALFGRLNMDIQHPGVVLSPLGLAVQEEWDRIPNVAREKGRRIRVLAKVTMPDHFHGVIFVEERMDVSVGMIIRGFKAVCTQRWRALMAAECLPRTADEGDKAAGSIGNWAAADEGDKAAADKSGAGPCCNVQPLSAGSTPMPPMPNHATEPDTHRMSRAQRARYYDTLPREKQPLFDDNYDESRLWSRGQLDAMLGYVYDNPRRAILKAMVPQFMQKRLCLHIGGVRYMAFGNILLLHKPVKEQVFCHRRARVGQLTADERQRLGITGPCHDDTLTSLPYTDTQAWRRERDTWIADAQDGVVLVTPGISPGEREMKNLAIANRLPLIHLQKEPITHKPERARFDACAEGSLLILAPWPEDLDSMRSRTDMGGTAAGSCPSAASIVSDYDRFHNLNELARMICELDTRSVPMTMRMMGER